MLIVRRATLMDRGSRLQARRIQSVQDENRGEKATEAVLLLATAARLLDDKN